MFAPPDFIPFSKLAELIYEDNAEICDWLQRVLEVDFDKTSWELAELLNFRASRAKIFSFTESAELALFETTRLTQKYVCHPDKSTFKFDLPILMNLEDYRSLYRMSDSFPHEYFDYGFYWPDNEKLIEEFVADGKDPWSRSFKKIGPTSINLFYSRTSFLVDLTEAKTLRSHGPLYFDARSSG